MSGRKMMIGQVGVHSESDVVALHLYVFDRTPIDVPEGLAIVDALFAHCNPAFPPHFVVGIAPANIAVRTLDTEEQAWGFIDAVLRAHRAETNLHAYVQMPLFGLPKRPWQKTRGWVVTFVKNAVVPAGAGENGIVILTGGVGSAGIGFG